MYLFLASCYVEVFLPGDEMEEGEELTFDSSAYELYHSVSIIEELSSRTA